MVESFAKKSSFPNDLFGTKRDWSLFFQLSPFYKSNLEFRIVAILKKIVFLRIYKSIYSSCSQDCSEKTWITIKLEILLKEDLVTFFWKFLKYLRQSLTEKSLWNWGRSSISNRHNVSSRFFLFLKEILRSGKWLIIFYFILKRMSWWNILLKKKKEEAKMLEISDRGGKNLGKKFAFFLGLLDSKKQG